MAIVDRSPYGCGDHLPLGMIANLRHLRIYDRCYADAGGVVLSPSGDIREGIRMNAGKKRRLGRALAWAAGMAVAASSAVAPAAATPEADNVVINEIYVGDKEGTYRSSFIELYNPTDKSILLDEMSFATSIPIRREIKYWHKLSGTIPPKGHYLIVDTSSEGDGKKLPSADAEIRFALPNSGSLILVDSDEGKKAVQQRSNLAGTAGVVDAVGWRFGNRVETKGVSYRKIDHSLSLNRVNGVDTDNNRADFVRTTPTPVNSSGQTEPES